MARSLKKNFLYQASYQLLLILVPLITTPYLSRVLGADSIGVYAYTYSVAGYFCMFAMLGLATYGVREIAAVGEDREARSRVFWAIYGTQLICGVIVAIVYFAYLPTVSQESFLPTLMWAFWVVGTVFDISWLFFGVEEFKTPTLISIATKLATLVIIFGFIHSRDDLWLYCLAISLSLTLNQILLWLFIRRYVDFSRPDLKSILPHFKPSLLLFLPVIAVSLYVSMDKVMLGLMSGMEQTGFYEYSEKLSKMPLAIIVAMGTVMLPRMTAALSEGKREEALVLLEDSIWAMLAMAFALGFGIAAIAPEFAPVFLGEEFAECDSIMMVLAIVIPIISTTNVLGRQYLLPTKRDSLFTLSVCIGAVVNIVLNFILIPLFAAMGAAIATVAAEISVLIAQTVMVYKELPLTRYAANALPFALMGVLMLFVIRAVAIGMNGVWGLSVQGLVLEVIVGVVVFLALAAIWCIVRHDPHFERVVGARLRRSKT